MIGGGGWAVGWVPGGFEEPEGRAGQGRGGRGGLGSRGGRGGKATGESRGIH